MLFKLVLYYRVLLFVSFLSSSDNLKDLKMSSASSLIVYIRVFTWTASSFWSSPAALLNLSKRRIHLGHSWGRLKVKLSGGATWYVAVMCSFYDCCICIVRSPFSQKRVSFASVESRSRLWHHVVIYSSSHWPIEGDIHGYALTGEHTYMPRSHYTRACVVQKWILRLIIA